MLKPVKPQKTKTGKTDKKPVAAGKIDEKPVAVSEGTHVLEAGIMSGIQLMSKDGDRECKVVFKAQKGRNNIVSLMEKPSAGAWVQKLQLVCGKVSALRSMMVMVQLTSEYALGTLPEEKLRTRREEILDQAAAGTSSFLVYLECR